MAVFDSFSGINVASGFKLQAKAPLDGRLVVASITDRDALITENGAYEGMLVYVKADKKVYSLTDLSAKTWKEVGSDSSNTNYYTKDEINNLIKVDGIKINGVAQTPDSNKDIDITIPTGALANKDIVSESDLDDVLKEKVNAASEGNHSHLNKAELDKIQTGDVAKWNLKNKITVSSAEPSSTEIAAMNSGDLWIQYS